MDSKEENPKDEDVFGLGCALEYFSEHKEVLEMIDNLKNVVGSNQSVVERAYEKFVEILKQYHEQPHLLDVHLEGLLSKTISVVRDPNIGMDIKHETFKYMYFIINVRGYKVIVRQLPHEVADFEPVLQLLEQQDPNNSETWTTRYVLLLWLSIIVMIPFHMSRLDGFDKDDEKSKTVMSRVLDVCKTYTVVPDKCRDAAAFLISKFLTRTDVKEIYMNEFLKWACELSVSKESSAFIKYGTLSSVAMIIKHGKRNDILPQAQKLLQWIINAEIKNHPGSNIQKLVYKIIQRIGLTFLPPKLATWRYQRGNRSLQANLSSGDGGTNTSDTVGGANVGLDVEDIAVPEEMEEVIDQLIQGLRSEDSVVRWSAAKGIGRVTGRLPKDLADEVVGSVLELFSPREGDGAWHGGSLALAELGRRGLLLPQRLPEVVPVVLKALVYDEPRGYSSVGSHIRDAACYVCWSFARAYDTEDLRPFVNDIASQLLIVTCFDREINCRRAASAAFQENVGRQGTFPHGIDILTIADFFSVSVRNNSYQTISVYIAQFPEYTLKLIDHLVDRTVLHWDLTIRELSAKALHNLTPLASDYAVHTVLPNLFAKTRSIDLNCRHGCILAIGEILHALSLVAKKLNKQMADIIGESVIEEARNLIPTYRERLYFRGMGGELMKQACSNFIMKCSLAHMPFHTLQIIDDWLALLDECLSYDVPNIRLGAIEALPAFISEYYNTPSAEISQTKIITKYIHEVESDSNQATRMAHALALGSMPAFMLKPHMDQIITALINTIQISPSTLKWSESRRDAIKALTNISTSLAASGDTGEFLTDYHMQKIYENFFESIKEYTQDNRGDIGAWVREATMNGMQVISGLMAETQRDIFSEDLVTGMMTRIAQQAVEKIDRTRSLAGKVFYTLLHNEPTIPNIPNYKELIAIFPKDECDMLNWNSAAITFPKFVKLLEFNPFTYSILVGLICSVGGMTETLVKNASQSLFDYLKMQLASSGKEEIARLCNEIINVFNNYAKNDRVVVPIFRFLDKLFSSGCIDVILEDETSEFAKNTLRLIQVEIRGCRDIYKLIDGINILCQYIQIKSGVCTTALVQLSILLCHHQPYVRRSTSIKLFESLLIYGDNSVIPEENLDEISNLLSTTNWENSIEEIKPIRNTLCTLMGTRIPVTKKSLNVPTV